MNKASKIYKYIFCFINALIGVFTLHFHYTILDIFGNNNEVYLDPFKVTDILIFILFFVIWLLLFYILDKFINKDKQNKSFSISNKKIFIIAFVILLITWAPYYFSFFPGGVYSDTYIQYIQATNSITGNGYSIFYSLLIRLLYNISLKNTTITFGLLTIIQVLLYIFSISYFITWLKNKNVSKILIVLSILFFGLYPRIPIYALSLWKDSLFSIFLFLYSLFIFEIIYSNGVVLKNKNNILLYCILCILVSLFRNNGYLLVVIMSFILLLKYRKNINEYRLFYISTIIVVLSTIVTYSIIFRLLGYNPPYRENIGVQIQQISYVVSNESNIDSDFINEINNIMPIDDIKSKYTPMIVDSVKNDSSFNNAYFDNNKMSFWLLYFKLMFKYPNDYIIALLLNNVGFWNYYTISYGSGSDSLLDFQEYSINEFVVFEDITDNIDIINNLFGLSIKNKIHDMAMWLNNCAIGTLIMFIGLYILLYKENNKYLLVYLPSIIIFVTLFFGTPCAFSSRYIIYTILFIPMSLIIPFIKDKKKSKN